MLLKNLPPLKVEVLRAQNIESQHSVSAIVVNPQGKIEFSWGATDLKIYPRSSIKAIQALAIILSGAADKFTVTDLELALASASHGGEIKHIEVVQRWLARIGLSYLDLECGPHLPSNQNAAIQLLKGGNDFTALHNNCSGKHAGMLATALALGENTQGYSRINHPVQKLIRNIIEDFCSEKIEEHNIAIDGCAIPTYYLHMKNLALAMARFGDSENFSDKYRQASPRVFRANVGNPFFVAGTDRYCTRIMTELNKRGLVKTGAEGVMFASLPELKLGVVVKVHDGATRAAEVAMSWILKELGLLSETSYEIFSQIPIKNWNQILTGSVRIQT